MSYYTNRRYNPPADVYVVSTLIGQHTGKRAAPAANWQTPVRGTNDQEYQIYLACANDGKGGDITRGGAPLKSYDEWLAS
jgi:hypothetical protein